MRTVVENAVLLGWLHAVSCYLRSTPVGPQPPASFFSEPWISGSWPLTLYGKRETSKYGIIPLKSRIVSGMWHPSSPSDSPSVELAMSKGCASTKRRLSPRPHACRRLRKKQEHRETNDGERKEIRETYIRKGCGVWRRSF